MASHFNSAYLNGDTHLKNINSTEFKMFKLFVKWVFNFTLFLSVRIIYSIKS